MVKERRANLSRRRVWTGALLLALTALTMLAGCGSAPSKTAIRTPPAPPAPTATVPPTTAGRLTLLARQAVGQAAQQVDVTYSASDEAVVDVTLAWMPAWRDHFSEAQAVAKQACYQTQAALWTSGVPLSKVTVIVLGQAVDDYASVITSAYAEADLTASHAHAISWAALTPGQAWNRYDNEFLRPTYAPNWVYLGGR